MLNKKNILQHKNTNTNSVETSSLAFHISNRYRVLGAYFTCSQRCKATSTAILVLTNNNSRFRATTCAK